MENVFKLLRVAFYIIVFSFGLTLLYLMSDRYRHLAETSADLIAEDDILYTADLADIRYDTTKAELIALLMDDILYDISIEDSAGIYSITAGTYHPEDLMGITLSGSRYDKSYIYDESGNIIRISYQSISND